MTKKLIASLLAFLITFYSISIITPNNQVIAVNKNPFASQDAAWTQSSEQSVASYDPSSPDLTPKSEAPPDEDDTLSGSYNVVFNSSASLDEIYACVSNYTYRLLGPSETRLFNIKTDDIQKFKDTYKNIVKSAEPDGQMSVSAIPNDPGFSYQWALSDMNLPQAWDVTTGSTNVKVAVIDTGYYRGLTDFNADSVLAGYDFTGTKHANVTNDAVGHGTKVSSVIGAATNNSYGMVGACWNVTLVPYKVDGADGKLVISDIITALNMAADAGCDVINMSFGSYYPDVALNTAIQTARNRGCILVSSAGNEGSDPEAGQMSYPASFDGVISVAAVDSSNTRAYFSQYNSKVDVSAPGVNIIVNNPVYPGYVGKDYISTNGSSGTSFSSPYVAGVAALARSLDSSINSDKFQSLIQLTSTDLGNGGRDDYYGYGLINAQAMMNKIALYTDPASGFTINKYTGVITGYSGNATDLVIPPQIGGVNVTGIGAYAFQYKTFKTLNVQAKIKTIGEGAFYVASLSSISLPNTITDIGNGAFDTCTQLTSIEIPSSIKLISKNVFRNCDSLTSISIPNGVVSIDTSAFEYCNNLKTVRIPDSVTSIGDGAFQGCTSLTDINLPKNIQIIGRYVFSSCQSLLSIVIPDGVTSLGDWAFSGCYALRSIFIPSSVTSISYYSFNACNLLTIYGDANSYAHTFAQITNIPFQVADKTIAGVVVKSSPNKTTYLRGQALDLTGAVITVSYNNGTAPIDIPVTSDMVSGYDPATAKQQTIAVNYHGFVVAFNVSVIMTSETDPANYINFNSITGTITGFINDPTILNIPYAINGYVVKAISANAFRGCATLTNVTIPSTIKTIGASAFSDCTNLKSVTIEYGVTNIGEFAFAGCTSLTSITLPASITDVGNEAFTFCDNLASISVDDANTVFKSEGGVLLSKDGRILVAYPSGYGATYTVPSSVTVIRASAFSKCRGLTEITLPEGINIIGNNAFMGSGLRNVTLPASLTNIGNSAFADCQSLTSFTVATGNTTYKSVNGVLFDKNGTTLITYPNLKSASYTIPEGVTTLGDYAFHNCANLTSITIPTSVGVINTMAFGGCTGLKSVMLPASVTKLGTGTFDGCSNLTSVYFLGNAPQVGDGLGVLPDTFKVYYNVAATGFTLTNGKWQGATAQAYCNLTFDSKGGSGVPASMVNYGSHAVAPTAPTLSKMTFAGWYKDQACTQEWNFATTTVTANITLYAKWDKAIGSISLKASPAKTTYWQGENLDLTGGVITVRYEDGSSQDMSITTSMVSGYQKNILGQQSLTVTFNGFTTSFSVTVKQIDVTYQTHVQDIGWQNWVENGAIAGTQGQSKRIEALKINVENQPAGLHIQYRAHVQNVGWQDWVTDGTLAGTTGKSQRVEALQIVLTGTDAQKFTVEYQAHVQEVGWQNWVSDGAIAGTTGQGLRIEALRIKIIPKIPDVSYQTHVQDIGWQNWVENGATAGTQGQSKRIEALKINIENQPAGLHIQYRTHVQEIGWQNWVSDGAVAGTTGASLRIEALQIVLTGTDADQYSVEYQAHVQNIGWQDWVSDGAIAGTTGLGYRVEALRIRIVPRQ